MASTEFFYNGSQDFSGSIIHHLILRRPDFPFFNAVCFGWLQDFPSKEVLSVKFYMNALLQQFPMGKVGKLHPFRENML